MEQVVDFDPNLNLVVDGSPINPQHLSVRTRGTAGPKVVVDPRSSTPSAGGLAAYAKAPSDKAGIFPSHSFHGGLLQ